ncbi:MAG: nodulation protein NodH, partial [Pseudomonadota bacterium]
GFDLTRREAEPDGLLAAIRAEAGHNLPVIRFFHDHDRRMVAPLVGDPRVAKVILRRNPLDSYISRKIAAQTGQWRMTDSRAGMSQKIEFEPAEFQAMLDEWSDFAARLRHLLQAQGQTAFEIGYDDLQDKAVLAGLLRFLRVEAEIDPTGSKLKPQNPGGPREKVSNPDEMKAKIAKLDPFLLDRSGTVERPRGPAVKRIVVTEGPGLMWMPVPGVAEDEMQACLADLGGYDSDAAAPVSGLNQRALRQWMRRHPGHQKFTIIRHPLARAHTVFCASVLPRLPIHAETRRRLRKRYDIPLPQDWPAPEYDQKAHRAAFGAWLRFLSSCLAGQTSLTPPAPWVGQLTCLQGIGTFALPDHILRAEDLAAGLARLSLRKPAPPLGQDSPFELGAIYNAELEALARQAYRRDYVFFGYEDWPAADYAA